MDGHIDVALVKEFYSNLYDPEDKSPKQVRVRGRLIKFNAASLNAFLETPPLIQPGEQYPSYSIFCRSRTDPQEVASKLCIPGHIFVLNAEGAPWKLLRKDLTTLAQNCVEANFMMMNQAILMMPNDAILPPKGIG